MTTESPKYAILTYTWGRFQAIDGSPALPVSGTTWKIPPVKEECFTVSSFQNVINNIGKRFKWLWLDVACIDQVQEEVKMAEVSRQVGIFHGATEAYAWLHSLEPAVAFRNMELLARVASYDPLPRQFDSDDSDDEIEEVVNLRLVHDQSQLDSIIEALRITFRDPWFTSLWTLQESILRRDALFLTADGAPMESILPGSTHSYHWRITQLNDRCREISRRMETYIREKRLSADEQIKAQAIISIVERVGFRFPDAMNPNVQFGAARYRETKYPLDRIYGIIGIYRSVLPSSFDLPNPKDTTFDELQTRFASALNEISPWLGQCFVHLDKPKVGKSWCITQNSSVPSEFQRINATLIMDPVGSIVIGRSGVALGKGNVCPLSALWQFWLRMRVCGLAFLNACGHYPLAIAYDKSISEREGTGLSQSISGPIVEWTNPALADSENDFSVTINLLASHRLEDLYVLHLGATVSKQGLRYVGPRSETPSEDQRPRICQMHDTNQYYHLEEKRGGFLFEEGNVKWGLRWERASHIMKMAFGIILRRDERGRWHRIGICSWADNTEQWHEFRNWESEIY